MLAVTRPFLIPVAVVFLGAAALVAQPAVSPTLPTTTEAGWRQYVAATDQRIASEMKASRGFLALDFTASATADRQAVRAGQMPVAQTETVGREGGAIDVADGWVHHFRGAVLIPRVRLDHVFTRLQESVPGTGQGDVIDSAIRGRDASGMRVFLKLRRTKLGVTMVYNTEHVVVFTRRGQTRGSSTSVATKIAELDKPGTAREREIGEGSRFLLRWNSYWRYEEVDTGVIAECESISLSRDAPWGFQAVAHLLASSTARESMERALINLREHFAATGRTPSGSSPARSLWRSPAPVPRR